MSIFKCKMCGGTLEINENQSTAVCEYCGTTQTLPKLDDDKRISLYDRANHFRRNNEFDKAMAIYENILNEDNTDAEAYWSLVLCRYGIEYVEDPATRKRVPTVNRAQFTSIFDDDNYKSALQYADGYQRHIYEEEANAINEIQKGILAISQKEEPFDVFICYKETDNNGRRTQDSVLANDLYHQLTAEGFKVFFSRITLEDKLGVAYEPYIFAALNSAKVMVVLGTKPEYFNAVWVKNEWSRYLGIVKQSAGKKILIPAYRDMEAYDLPDEFSHLQAQDMSKLGFMQDLIRGIRKIISVEEPKAVVKETIISSGEVASVEPLLERAYMYLEDRNWQSANEYCERVLDQEPKNVKAYLGKLLAELKCERVENLKEQEMPFDNKDSYAKVMRFGSEKLKAELQGYNDYIRERNETIRKDSIYNDAQRQMQSAKTEDNFKSAATRFGLVSGYKDADSLMKECLEKAVVTKKNTIYDKARELQNRGTISDLKRAINEFSKIAGWKDADERKILCEKQIENIKENKDKVKKKIIIITSIIIAVVAVFMITNLFIIPNVRYSGAKSLMRDGKYEEAIEAFEELEDFKDSEIKILECEIRSKYEEAVELVGEGKYIEAVEKMGYESKYEAIIDEYNEYINSLIKKFYDTAVVFMNESKYESALEIFNMISSYKDVKEKITECNNTISQEKYDEAAELISEKKYEEALEILKEISGYEGVNAKITECNNAISQEKYEEAAKLINEEKYTEALKVYKELGDYKDSKEKIKKYQFLVCEVGSTVVFGNYEQDNNTSNGKEEIEWLVLAKENNKALVISKYILDCQKYNSEWEDITWEKCTLRTWLNGTFMNAAFSTEEKKKIVSSKISNPDNSEYGTEGGKDTTDKLFLLSIDEANKYFKSSDARMASGTEYAKDTDLYIADNGNSWWWLRSPGDDSDRAAIVSSHGYVDFYGNYVRSSKNGVRPALWINLEP